MAIFTLEDGLRLMVDSLKSDSVCRPYHEPSIADWQLKIRADTGSELNAGFEWHHRRRLLCYSQFDTNHPMSRPNDLSLPIRTVLRKLRLSWVVGFLLLLFVALPVVPSAFAQSTGKQAQIDAVNLEMTNAMDQVRKIVNQPVVPIARVPGMRVGKGTAWFDIGFPTPDFKQVDVRTSQEFPYTNFDYITSDLNPGVVFLSRDLEFNENLKYFYTDYSRPKKKLTESEMLEINRLFRIIWHCQQQVEQLQKPDSERIADPVLTRFAMLKSSSARIVFPILLVLAITYLVLRACLKNHFEG
jgi:hypothetical protein